MSAPCITVPLPRPHLFRYAHCTGYRRAGPRGFIVTGAVVAFVLAPIIAALVFIGTGDTASDAVRTLPLFKPGSHKVSLDAGRTAVVYAYVGSAGGADGVGASRSDDLINTTPVCDMTGPGAVAAAVPGDVRTGVRVIRDGSAFDSSYVYRARQTGTYTLACDDAVLLDTASSIEVASIAWVGLGLVAGAAGFIVGAAIVVLGIVLTVRENRRRSMASVPQLPQRW